MDIRRRLSGFERLEGRLLMAADVGDLAHSSGLCTCPICTGFGLNDIPPAILGSATSNPLSSLPQLSSNPGATAKLYLDFNGNYEPVWGSWLNATTPVYDQDGDLSTFSTGELQSISDIWARVAEDYAPFNIDVTTIDPGTKADRIVAHIAIGGGWTDWFGQAAGGVAYVGGFYNSAPNVGYVFENDLGNGNSKYVAEAASHEAGHLFGLQHQSTWSGNTLVEQYNSGNGSWAPIMGVGYYAPRTTWHNGPTPYGATAYQDDMSILAGASNGFGYRTDDFGSTRSGASVLPVNGTSVNFSGLIGRSDDVDVWSFTTGGGAVSFQLAVAPSGANLAPVLELWDANGNVLANPTSVGAGTYYLAARGLGDYGNVGQYTITGTVPGAVEVPEIAVSVSGSNLESGGTVSFGSTNVGSPVTRTITVTNQGNADLVLNPLAGVTLPAGFTLVNDLSSTILISGQSTSFTLQLDAASAGSFSGSITLVSNDSDEGLFVLVLNGSATVPDPPVVRIADNRDAGHVLIGAWTGIAQGYGGDSDIASKGNGSSRSEWTFTDLPAGQYRVLATWVASRKNASNAPFTLLDGSVTRANARANQRSTPSDLQSDGASWKLLGTITVESGRAVVRLTNSANGQVVADAVRIEKVPAASPRAVDAALMAFLIGTPRTRTSKAR